MINDRTGRCIDIVRRTLYHRHDKSWYLQGARRVGPVIEITYAACFALCPTTVRHASIPHVRVLQGYSRSSNPSERCTFTFLGIATTLRIIYYEVVVLSGYTLQSTHIRLDSIHYHY